MKYGAEFEHNGLWYGWDADSNGYWAWCDEAQDWVEYQDEEGAEEEVGQTEEVQDAEDEDEAEVAQLPQDLETTETSDSPMTPPRIGQDVLYYVVQDETYYFNGGGVEYDEDWAAYYYYTDPHDDEQYDWIPEDKADLATATEIETYDDLPYKMEENVPADMHRAASIDMDNNADSPPDLYFDQISENYFYLGLQVHYKKDAERYYVIDRLRRETVDLPPEAVENIEGGTVTVWNSVATSGIVAPILAQVEEGEDEGETVASEEEVEEPKKVDIAKMIPKPKVAGPIIPNGSIFHIKQSDLEIYNAGSINLTEDDSPSLFNETLRDHFQMSRWGEYLVGRCRRTFGGLIRGETQVDGLISRLPELTGLVQHLTDLQLLMIWKYNCDATKWTHASEESIRAFVFKIERNIPALIFIRCLMRGLDQEEGETAYYVPKYYSKEKNRTPVVEKAQTYMPKWDESHIKNMGRVILLAHGSMHLEPKLKDFVKKCPWWVLPAKDKSPETPEVYYNCQTLQAFTSEDRKRPEDAIKLVCTWKPGEEKTGFHVCKA